MSDWLVMGQLLSRPRDPRHEASQKSSNEEPGCLSLLIKREKVIGKTYDDYEGRDSFVSEETCRERGRSRHRENRPCGSGQNAKFGGRQLSVYSFNGVIIGQGASGMTELIVNDRS